MNLRKQKYALEELNNVYHTTVVGIYTKHTEEGKTLTPRERCQIMGNTFLILRKDITEVNLTDPIDRVFDLSAYEYDAKRDQDKVDEDIEKVEVVYKSIKDIVALGDEDNAMSILKEFKLLCAKVLKA